MLYQAIQLKHVHSQDHINANSGNVMSIPPASPNMAAALHQQQLCHIY
jgi:hypothetical protein